jgi:phosphoglycolate phosphatase
MRLILFDIDGTLMLTGGAGMRAFYRALEQVFGIPVDRDVIRPDGKTDPLIAREFLRHFDQETRWDERSREALFSRYVGFLEEEIRIAAENRHIRLLPGVTALLDSLSGQPDFAVGLVTGNLERGAQIKLAGAGLTRYFHFGGYGSDSEDRTTLIRIGIQRGAQWIAPAPVEDAIVIGDTPLDIIHGRAAGARVIAVASAKYALADLHSHNPDLLLPDLTPIDRILAFMRSSG